MSASNENETNINGINLIAVKQLFDQCVDVDPSEWPSLFGQSQCNEVEIIQVEELLALAANEQQHSQHESIISQQLQDLGQKMMPNQRLGPYQIEHEIGRGGMGIVFLAHRADGLYEQKVAIKITPSFASQEELQRFHLERQILAQLQHPNIAMLLDGGTTPDNRPFLVMEYVNGEPITSYANSHNLNLKQRLKLFCAVCEAVNFAHDCLIVHRDLKPENVLVTDEGKVKLLDFGVSKMLQSEQLSGNTTMQQGLTLAYASPEQVKGERSTTATDIYGLGALLYELLCATVPHPVKTNSPEQAIQNICLKEPLHPSQVVGKTAQPLHYKALKGDLDNIVAQALRKEPVLRYASAIDLQADIQRYLKGQAVLATPRGHWYRLTKFVKRHPISTALAGALVMALNAGLIISLNLNQQLVAERDQLQKTQIKLEQQVVTADQVIDMLTDMFRAASPNKAQGKVLTVDDLVNTALAQIQTSLQDQPEVKSRLLTVLSDVHYYVGKDQKAVELLEQALTLKKQIKGALTAVELGDLGNRYRMAGQYDNAEKYLQQSMTLLEQTRETSVLDKIKIYSYLGLYYNERSDFEQALRFFTLQHQHWTEQPNEEIDPGATGVRYNLANSYRQLQQQQKALEIMTSVLADRQRLYGKTHPKIVETLSWLAGAYMENNQMDYALEASSHSYQLAQKLFEPNMNRYFESVITHAEVLMAIGEYQQAVALFAAEITPAVTNKRAKAYYDAFLSTALLNLGDYQQGVVHARQGFDILNPIYKDSIAFMYEVQSSYGLLAILSDTDIKQGTAMLQTLYAGCVKQWGEQSQRAGLIMHYLGISELHKGEFTQAQAYFDKAAKTFDQVYDANHKQRGALAQSYGELYMAQRQWSEALPWLQKSLTIFGKSQAPGTLPITLVNAMQAEALWHMGDKRQASVLLKRHGDTIINQVTTESVYHQYTIGLQQLISTNDNR
ncbi:MAG: serine/threonine protein kinase [Algicola sp.]|nr:serine/threonine protein kinase [Algicola sp.]